MRFKKFKLALEVYAKKLNKNIIKKLAQPQLLTEKILVYN